MVKLSKVSKRILEEFDEAAKQWAGIQEVDGPPRAVDRAQKRYDFAKAALEKRIAHLERKANTPCAVRL